MGTVYNSFAAVLDEQASQNPEKIAYTFLKDGADEEQNITYARLKEKAETLAAHLLQHSTPGDRALLLFGQGLDFIIAFYGCLYAGIIAVPSAPPRSRRSIGRLSAVVEDAGARLILSDTSTAARNRLQSFEAAGCRVMLTDQLSGNTDRRPPAKSFGAGREDVAFLQYTSGSTSLPKGVMVTHGNILANVDLIVKMFRQDRGAVIVSWLPNYHDMGLIGGLLVSMYLCGRSILLAPLHFTQSPVRWLRTISKYRAATSGGANFGYELCCNSINKEELTGIDLSCWKTAFVGAEPVRWETLDHFTEAFSAAGFAAGALQPCYGLAEATLLVSAAASGKPPRVVEWRNDLPGTGSREMKVVSCGRPEELEVCIVNDAGEISDKEEIGEVLVRGKSVAAGYWNKPADTTFRFFTREQEGPYLRTGDLGFIRDGELFITGRLKDVIIINGRNYYPHDLAYALTHEIPELVTDGCTCLTVDDGQQERLIVVSEVRSGLEREHLFRKIRALLFGEFGLEASQIMLIRKGTMPKTTSGKIQRHACLEGLLSGTLSTVDEWSAGVYASKPYKTADDGATIEKKVLDALAMLSEEAPPGLDEHIFYAGLSSIKLARLSMFINEAFGIDLPVDFIFENPTVRALCAEIRKSSREVAAIAVDPPAPVARTWPLGPTQQGIWFDQQLKPGSNSYNIPVCLDLDEDMDISLLDEVFNGLVQDYELLRTSFVVTEDGPAQVIHEHRPVKGTAIYIPDAGEAADHIKKQVCRVFDLSEDVLFRYGLVKTGAQRNKLFLVAHHIILDGTSLLYLLKEVLGRYGAAKEQNDFKPALSPAQFRDYISTLSREPDKAARDYWRNRFQGGFTAFRPVPHRQGAQLSDKGNTILLQVDQETAHRIKTFSAANSCTSFTSLLAAFAVAISRLSGSKELLIGVPVSGRDEARLQQMLGVFINAILLPVRITHDTTFSALVQEVRKALLSGLKYQQYPLHLLARDLGMVGAEGQGTFTSVFFNGLGFFDRGEGAIAAEAFRTNYGLDMNLDLNAYVFEHAGGMTIRLDYKEALFDRESMAQLLSGYLELICEMIEQPGTPLLAQWVPAGVSAEEAAARLQFAYGRSAEIPSGMICQRIEQQAAQFPGRTAIIYKDEIVSYGRINAQANALALKLRQQGLVQGEFVPVLMNKSIELPLSILALMKLGMPFVPMDTGWPEERLALLLRTWSPRLVLVREGDDLPVSIQDYPTVVIGYDTLPDEHQNPVCPAGPDDPVYGMFTSGTTGVPKCAVNLHKGIMNRFAYMDRTYGCTPEDVILFTSRHIYDAAVWQMFWPLTNGARLVIPEDGPGLDLHEITALIAKERVTITDFVPSVFNLFAEYLESDERLSAGVRSLRQLLIGGEAMNAKAVRRFRKLHPEVGITNTYGPTEASIGTIFYEVPVEIPDIIPIGRPIDNVSAFLLDGELSPVPFGTTGELYLGGVCVGSGYLNDPSRTAEVFVKNPFPGAGSEYLYKTGDLAFYLPGGDLQFCGRKDSQVKINGIRVECGEVESVLLSYPTMEEAVAIPREDNTGKWFLTAVLKLAVPAEAAAIDQYLRQRLPGYMIPIGYAFVDVLPRTLNGKADRKALAALPWQMLQERHSAPAKIKEREFRLLDIWKEVLGDHSLSVSDNFFTSGGDSLKAMQLLTRIHKRLHTEISLAEIFRNPTVAAQAALLQDRQLGAWRDIPALPAAERYDLSHAQKRMWLLSRFPETATAYHMPVVMELSGSPDITALRKSFTAICARHEILRTTFVEKDGVPYQNVSDTPAFLLEELTPDPAVPGSATACIEQFLTRPFDLEKGPLFRAGLLKAGPEQAVLVIVMHHIISDAWSLDILLQELLLLYRHYAGQEKVPGLSPLPAIHYKDFAAWQNLYLESPEIKQHKAYWLQQLSGRLPVLNLRTDHPRPAAKTYNGAVAEILLPAETIAGLTAICTAGNATLFMGLLAAVNLFLYRYTGDTDIIIGSPLAGRYHEQLEQMPGFFVNTVPLRSHIYPERCFAEILQDIRQITLGAYDHQVYPFDSLVDELSLVRDPSRHPLFDVMIVLLDQADTAEQSATGLQWRKLPFFAGSSKFDLSFNFTQTHSQLNLRLEYNTDLFLEDTIHRMAGHFITLLNSIVAAENRPVSELELITSRERRLLLQDFNDTSTAYPADKTLTGLFEEQVQKAPGETALVFGGKTMSFAELNEQANRLGHYLRDRFRLKPDDLVGVRLERSEWMIIALLGVLKAGAAYVPIDPELPAERVDYITRDSGCKLIIDEQELQQFRLCPEYPAMNPLPVNGSRDLAYVIYTSGSTGNPKGCMLEHRGVVNRIAWMRDEYRLTEADVILQKTTFSFDVSVWEIFLPLCFGGKMVLCRKEDTLVPERLLDLISVAGVTCMHFVPSLFNAFIAGLEKDGAAPAKLAALRMIITSGEELTAGTLKSWYELTDIPVYNLYGPTEASVDVTHYATRPGDRIIPIGRPIYNTRIYILDAARRLVPPGVLGEICIGGDGLARGYLNKPEESLARFIPDPFREGAFIYLTGDLGRWLPDGNIEFAGRKDQQLKIRGLRIEPGEIESRIRESGRADEAVVLARDNGAGEKYLVAYLAGNRTTDTTALREYLAEYLPAYMVPAYYVQLAALPLTPSGKIDKSGLPDPLWAATDAARVHVAPRNEVEEKLSAIWSEMLKVERISVLDDFFSLGGHSLIAVRVLSRIRETFGCELPVSALFDRPTIAKISELVSDATLVAAGRQPAIRKAPRTRGR